MTESPETHRQNTRAFRENVLDVVKSLKNSLGARAYAEGKADLPRAAFRGAARDAIKKTQAITKSPRGRDHSNRPEFQQANRDRQKLQFGYVKYPEVNYNKQGQANPETKVPRHLSGHKKEVINKAIERPIEVVSRARWSSNLEHNRTTGVFNKQRISQKLTPSTSAGTAKEKTVESLPKSVKLARDYAAANPDYNGDHTKWRETKKYPVKTWNDFNLNDPASEIALSNYKMALDQVEEFENDDHYTFINTPIERAIDSYAQNAADAAKEQGLGKKVAGDAFENVFALARINKLLRRRT